MLRIIVTDRSMTARSEECGRKSQKEKGSSAALQFHLEIRRRALLIGDFQAVTRSYREEAVEDKGHTFPGIAVEKVNGERETSFASAKAAVGLSAYSVYH